MDFAQHRGRWKQERGPHNGAEAPEEELSGGGHELVHVLVDPLVGVVHLRLKRQGNRGFTGL